MNVVLVEIDKPLSCWLPWIKNISSIRQLAALRNTKKMFAFPVKYSHKTLAADLTLPPNPSSGAVLPPEPSWDFYPHTPNNVQRCLTFPLIVVRLAIEERRYRYRYRYRGICHTTDITRLHHWQSVEVDGREAGEMDAWMITNHEMSEPSAASCNNPRFAGRRY